MKKFVSLMFLVVSLGLSQDAASQFLSDSTSVHTVAAVKQMPNNSWFTLEGHIVKQVRDEHYIFRDQSGELEVEIDDDKWKGRRVDPNTKVRIWGEVEKGFLKSIELEVERIELIGTNVKDQRGSIPPK